MSSNFEIVEAWLDLQETITGRDYGLEMEQSEYHLREHYFKNITVEDCLNCHISPLLSDLREHGDWESFYHLSDGYGTVGLVPEQGLDWSGIRDSTPAAICNMHHFVFGNPA